MRGPVLEGSGWRCSLRKAGGPVHSQPPPKGMIPSGSGLNLPTVPGPTNSAPTFPFSFYASPTPRWQPRNAKTDRKSQAGKLPTIWIGIAAFCAPLRSRRLIQDVQRGFPSLPAEPSFFIRLILRPVGYSMETLRVQATGRQMASWAREQIGGCDGKRLTRQKPSTIAGMTRLKIGGAMSGVSSNHPRIPSMNLTMHTECTTMKISH